MSNSVCADVNRRQDFVLLFDVTDGNPNGDPDAGNLPRVDPETMHGLVTDVCIKRKVRDWVYASAGDQPGMDIFVKHRGILAEEQKRAYLEVKAEPGLTPNEKARQQMCRNHFDVRMFGAVMTTGKSGKRKNNRELQWNCGQVRGPIQLTFARSIDPIVPLDLCITRVALTNPGDVERADAEAGEEGVAASGQMGRKALVPYGLYRTHGFFVPSFAKATGASSADLEVFWTALQQMWDLDRSASRGMMACRGLYVFSHQNGLGNAPAHQLFDLISIKRKDGVTVPRSFGEYEVLVGEPPKDVALTALVG